MSGFTITTWRCGRCQIRFRVGKKPQAAWASEYTICVEKGCSQRFWHAGHNGHGNRPIAKCGIDPQDIAA